MILLALFALSSCELFQLRESNAPTEEAAWNDFATTLELATQNLEYSYEDSRNAVNYHRLFHENYRFYFAAQDVTDFATDSEWNSAQEQDMLINLHTRYSKMNVTLSPMVTADEISLNEAKLYRSYSLTVKPSSGSDVQLASGNLELHYKRLYGYWYLYRWYDYRSGPMSTWGILKHENG